MCFIGGQCLVTPWVDRYDQICQPFEKLNSSTCQTVFCSMNDESIAWLRELLAQVAVVRHADDTTNPIDGSRASFDKWLRVQLKQSGVAAAAALNRLDPVTLRNHAVVLAKRCPNLLWRYAQADLEFDPLMAVSALTDDDDDRAALLAALQTMPAHVMVFHGSSTRSPMHETAVRGAWRSSVNRSSLRRPAATCQLLLQMLPRVSTLQFEYGLISCELLQQLRSPAQALQQAAHF